MITNRGRVPAVVLAVVAALLLPGLTPAPARAATVPAPTVSPATVAAGTTTTVSGVGCRPTPAVPHPYVDVNLLDPTSYYSRRVEPSTDGSWSVAFTPEVETPAGSPPITAVCRHGNTDTVYPAVTLHITASAANAWAVQKPALPVVPNGTLTDIDCASATSCVAVGRYLRAGVGAALLETWNGTGWTLVDVPTAGAATVGLSGVSCTSSTTCVAVGAATESQQPSTERGFVTTLSGTRWTSRLLPAAADGGYVELADVACATSSSCVAVGTVRTFDDDLEYDLPTAYRFDGTRWTVSPPAYEPAGLSAVSCPTAAWCAATGTAAGGAPVVEVLAGSTWTVQATAPIGSDPVSLAGIDCTSPGNCVAVGSIGFESVPRPVVETSSADTWSYATIDPSVAGTTGGLADVDCAAPGRCTAVGFRGTDFAPTGPLAVRSGTTWTDQAVAVAHADLAGVACPTASTCVAAGTAGGLPVAVTAARTAAFVDAAAATPKGFTEGQFTGVSCPATDACTAVGWVQDVARAPIPFVNRWDGTAWRKQTLPDLGAARLLAVNCAGTSRCVAVGAVGAAGDPDETPLVITWNGSAWSTATVQRVTAATVGEFDAVSCGQPDSCLAVGHTAPGGGTPLTASLTGTTWRLAPKPPVGTDRANLLSGVSCLSSGATACRVVGVGLGRGSSQRGLDLTWNGTRWAVGPDVAPLGSIACVAVASCLALQAPDSSSEDSPLSPAFSASHWNGTAWNAEAVPNPSPFREGFPEVYGVSCRDDLACVAVGHSNDGEGHGFFLARRSADGSWRLEPVGTDRTSTIDTLYAADCPADNRCLAVGNSGPIPVIALSVTS